MTNLVMNSKKIFEIDFKNIATLNDKCNSERAILKSITVNHVNDDFSDNEMKVIAIAEIYIPFTVKSYNKEKGIFENQTNYKIQNIDSGGIYGISNDSDENYIVEIENNEVGKLMNYLKILNINSELF